MKFTKCGVLSNGIGLSPIYCDNETGDMIYVDDINGNCVMSNLGSPDPVEAADAALNKIMTSYNLDGVILTDQYIIFLKDWEASYRKYDTADEVVQTVDFDIDITYEGDVLRRVDADINAGNEVHLGE